MMFMENENLSESYRRTKVHKLLSVLNETKLAKLYHFINLNTLLMLKFDNKQTISLQLRGILD